MKKKNKKTSKLELRKFIVVKLNNMNMIKGGNQTTTFNTETSGTGGSHRTI